MQTVREISSVVTPTIIGTAAGAPQLGLAAKGSKLKLLNNPLTKKIGEMGFAAGVGAFVDYASETSEGDNASGVLKKAWPKAFGWIPDSIATGETDTPDEKRVKNVTEGVGLGLLTDVLVGAIKLVAGARGVRQATQWIPENEKAGAWLTKNVPKRKQRFIDRLSGKGTLEDDFKLSLDEPAKPNAVDVVEEAVAESAAKRSDALDELGAYNFSKSQNLDEPMLGVHDMYGYEESGIRAVDDMGIVGASVDQARIAKNKGTVAWSSWQCHVRPCT